MTTMIVKHAEGNMEIAGATARKAAKKLLALEIEEATLIEKARPHTGRVLKIKAGKISLVR